MKRNDWLMTKLNKQTKNGNQPNKQTKNPPRKYLNNQKQRKGWNWPWELNIMSGR